MAMASPTPLGSSHFGLTRRSSRQALRKPASRPNLARGDPLLSTQPQTRQYADLNDSSDDELMPPMMLSALTNAILDNQEPFLKTSPKYESPNAPHNRSGSAGLGTSRTRNRLSSEGKGESPVNRRVVRLSGTPLSLRRSSLSTAVQRRAERAAEAAESPLDLSTPGQAPRTVRIAISRSGSQKVSGGSSRLSSRADSAAREEEPGSQEYPSTAVRTRFAASQGSVSRYGSSTIGRGRYGDDMGLQSSMGLKKVGGGFMSGPARRGRLRMNDEEQSPVEEQGDGLDAVGSSQEPESQESQVPESQEQDGLISSQESEAAVSSFYAPHGRDFASGSPPVSSRDVIRKVLRSNSPPPPTLSSGRNSASPVRDLDEVPKPTQPIFKVPAPRPDLPAAHDQENEAPPTFKRNKPVPSIQLDSLDKKPTRPESMDMDALRKVSPGRHPLALRSQNTPRRPAPPPPKMSVLEAATTTAGAATTSHASKRRNVLKVNGKSFTRIDVLGRGGSSKVYKVMAENSKFFALKRVSLEDADEAAVRGFKGEIDLLRKLESVDRVIRLYDYELNEAKGTLSVLMEMGEMDMNSFLNLRLSSEHAKFDPSFVRHYWKEMLECLQAVHEHDIVHSDLKPHNFVLVQGRLKLIDFGIANAIQTDETVNVHRDTQIGTPNYMSPESLLDSNAKPDSRGRINANEPKLMKLGKPSDVWSLGCILYQMTYGRAPFAHIQNQMQRCQAIINFKYEIEYPTVGIGSVPVPAGLITTLKKCLNREQHQRPSCTELLSETDPFLNPPDVPEGALPMTEELLGRILVNVMQRCKNHAPTDAELLSIWPKGYFASMRRAAEGAS
ncbi:hypothetical protein BP6252_02011 [Coleophoma cylindrospora]|uniref:Protein kinase domain-containing protein n=1 Tax=Coleophoma cylindrospora TaxID=1849047 RepID=A0A3D8SE16_9HELO|nr:hypothetical protein BP6252_02011 [Coleophoma cylindrospora]